MSNHESNKPNDTTRELLDELLASNTKQGYAEELKRLARAEEQIRGAKEKLLAQAKAQEEANTGVLLWLLDPFAALLGLRTQTTRTPRKSGRRPASDPFCVDALRAEMRARVEAAREPVVINITVHLGQDQIDDGQH